MNKLKKIALVSLSSVLYLWLSLWPMISFASYEDPTDNTGISMDAKGNLISPFSNKNNNNIPVTVEPPQYTQPPFNTTGGGNYGGRDQQGEEFRGNYSWEPENQTAARIGGGPAQHKLEGTPFRGTYHWEEGQSRRTPGGSSQITHQLEGTPFRGTYHWEEGQSRRTPGGATQVYHKLEGTPFRGNYPWK